MSFDVQLGFEAEIKYRVGGQAGVGEWLHLANVKGNTLDQTNNEVDVTTRDCGGERQYIPGLRATGAEFDILWDPLDAGCLALYDAFWNREVIGMQFLDRDGYGYQADVAVFKFPRSEALEEGVSITVGVKPTLSATPPTRVVPAP